MEQSERGHPGGSLPASQEGGMQGEWSRTLAKAGSVVETHHWAETGPEWSFSAKQPFPQQQVGAVALCRETKTLPGPISSFTPELCSCVGPGQQTPLGD